MGSQRVGHNLVTKQQLYIPPAHLDGVFTLFFHVWFLGVSSLSPREAGVFILLSLRGPPFPHIKGPCASSLYWGGPHLFTQHYYTVIHSFICSMTIY